MAFRFIPAWCAAGSMVLTQEAKEAAATRRKEQTDRCSFTAKRIKDKIKNSQDKAANKINAAVAAAKVAPAVAAAAAGLRTWKRRQRVIESHRASTSRLR